MDGEDRVIDEDPTGELEPIDPFAGTTGDPAPSPVEEGAASDPHAVPSSHAGLTTVVIQGLLGVAVVVLLATDPYTFTALEELIGFGLVVFGLFEVVGLIRHGATAGHYAQPIGTIVAGVVLVVWPQQTLTVAGYFLAGVIGLRGIMDIWAGVRRWHESGANAWVFVRGSIAVVLALLVFLFPSQSVFAVVVGGAVLAILRTVISVWFVVSHADAMSSVEPGDTYGIVTYWLSRREMDAIAAEDVEKRVFVHLGDMRERVWRFAILMALATTIATFGIGTDSTAVVIGAMLVAPLMTPILGVAAGLINGRTRSTITSATVVFLGSFGAIALAWLLAALVPDLQTVVQNGQVTSRTAPSLMDLGIAIAAGAAGAYGVSRAESTDALPGVAVAIALVPPLAVVGITLHAGDLDQATGAFLLFLTNLFSIVLMAGFVFVLVGYGSWGRIYHRRNRIRVSFAAVVLAVILISIPLALTAQQVIQSSADVRGASAAIETWLGDDTALRIDDLEVDGDTVTVQLVGPTEPPPVDDLADEVSARIGRPMTTVVRWVAESEEIARSRT